MISCQRFIATMGLSRTVSEINGDFSRKSQYFPTHRVFCAHAEGVPLGIGYRRSESKKAMEKSYRWGAHSALSYPIAVSP